MLLSDQFNNSYNLMNQNTTANSFHADDKLKNFKGLALLLSLLFFLTSCSTPSKKNSAENPAKSFQYTFQAPTRTFLDPKLKLGRSYFSASGYACKKYTLQSGRQGSACKIKGRWYSSSPILLENSPLQH